MQKCMSLEQPTITPYSPWYPLAVDTSSTFYISRDDCRRHTSSAGAICSQPQNDDSSRPAHSKQPDYSPSAKKENDKERVPARNQVMDQNSAVIGVDSGSPRHQATTSDFPIVRYSSDNEQAIAQGSRYLC